MNTQPGVYGRKLGTDPAFCGWTPIALVDTRPKDGEAGGQYGSNLWTKYMGKTVEQLNAEWKDDLKKNRIGTRLV